MTDFRKLLSALDKIEYNGKKSYKECFAPVTPASLSVTGGSADEVTKILKDLSMLAGTTPIEPSDNFDNAMDVDILSEPNDDLLSGDTVELDSEPKQLEFDPSDHNDISNSLRNIDSLNGDQNDGQDELDRLEMGHDEIEDEAVDDRIYTNSPGEQIEPHDYGNKQVDPQPQGLKQRRGDNPYRTENVDPIQAFTKHLMNEYNIYKSRNDALEEARKKPSSGLSKKEKSKVSKDAHKGKDIGKKGKNFKKVAAKASKEYGSKEAGEKVAAAAMWKNSKR